ncbi:MAG: hypothetical protein ACRCTQ_05955 [Brevinemataceae bacterium]
MKKSKKSFGILKQELQDIIQKINDSCYSFEEMADFYQKGLQISETLHHMIDEQMKISVQVIKDDDH